MKKRKLACETPAGDSMATPSTARKVPKTDQRPTRADFWSILPDIPKGFTQDVYEEHISALQKENRLAKPNQAKITELMKSTFEVRRRDIMRKIQPIKEIVCKYPPLATCAGVSKIYHNSLFVMHAYTYSLYYGHFLLKSLSRARGASVFA
jgi:hypothetical protein